MSRFRFTLRIVAIAFLLFAMLLGYWSNLATQKRSITSSIQRDGGIVSWSDKPSNSFLKPLTGLLPKVYWAEVLAIEATNITDEELASISRYFKGVESIRLQNPRLTTDGVQRLAALRSLSHLAIIGDKCPKLTHLHLCKRMNILEIHVPGFGSDEVANLSRLPSLKLLQLSRSRVTSDDLDPFFTSLPNCEVEISNSLVEF